MHMKFEVVGQIDRVNGHLRLEYTLSKLIVPSNLKHSKYWGEKQEVANSSTKLTKKIRTSTSAPLKKPASR